MDIIFNDIAMKYQFKDKYEAMEKIKTGVEAIIYFRRQDTSFKISSQEKITGLEIAPGYYFSQLFSEKNEILSQNYKTAIKTFFANFNILACENDKFIFDGIESVQCGLAYRENGLLFSLGTRSPFFEQKISGEYTLDGQDIKSVEIGNIAKKEHVDIHWLKLRKRIYEANPKHKANYGWGSLMDLKDDEAQFVLDRAIKAENDERHLIARYKNIYYSFRCHWKNYYHGYQDHSMPEDMKRKLKDISIT